LLVHSDYTAAYGLKFGANANTLQVIADECSVQIVAQTGHALAEAERAPFNSVLRLAVQ